MTVAIVSSPKSKICLQTMMTCWVISLSFKKNKSKNKKNLSLMA